MSIFDVEIRNDPLGLLNNVEKLMHTPQRAKYPPITLIEVLLKFLKLRQGDKESLIDYCS